MAEPEKSKLRREVLAAIRASLAVLAIVASTLALEACGGDRHASRWVDENKRLLDSVPGFPGAELVAEVSTPYYSEADPRTPIGYTTRRVYRVSSSTTLPEVGSYYEERLDHGWRLVEEVKGRPGVVVWNFRRGRATLSINAENIGRSEFEATADARR
jgi:hypothetical protein